MRGIANWRRDGRRRSRQWIGIGERRKPDPQGRPGFLRVDTVHQGDWEGVKGVYHINAVDEETQWQVVGCVARITEQHLLPVLEAILHQFPFRIVEFHSDNGSEFVNHDVDGMLKDLLIEFTKSRANRSQDNALVEGKNGAIIRKHMATVTSPPNMPKRYTSSTPRTSLPDTVLRSFPDLRRRRNAGSAPAMEP